MTGFARPPKAGDGRLRVVQSISIDPRRKVVLIECDGRGHLLLTGGGGDVSLGWVASEGAPLAAGGAPMQEKS
jgi:flagellar protein FliO/FliZ